MKKVLFFTLFCLFAFPAHSQDADAYEDYPEYAEEDYQYDEAYGGTDGYENEQPREVLPPDAEPAPAIAAPAVEPAPAAEAVTNTNAAPIQKEVYIPLFMGTAPGYAIDPANPKLPGNHPFLRLRGTLWRSDEVLLSTNVGGVVSARRMYLVFDAARSAVAFASAPYNAPTLSDYPSSEEYIELIPLLETNTYKPSPYQSRYIEIPEKYYRPTPKPMMDTNTPPPAPEIPVLPEAAPADAAPPAIEAAEEGAAMPENEPAEEPLEDGYTDEYEYTEEAPEYEAYSMLPLRYVAQNAAPETPLVQAVVNIGGLEGGIFVDKPRNSVTPYTVLFLALEKDNTLSVYTIQNSFDIRLDTPEIIQARALYKKAFEVRANMKPFRRVDTAESPTAPLLKNFFK